MCKNVGEVIGTIEGYIQKQNNSSPRDYSIGISSSLRELLFLSDIHNFDQECFIVQRLTTQQEASHVIEHFRERWLKKVSINNGTYVYCVLERKNS